jgi:uncharacterized membrane protein YhaH (DUF805 family)
MNDAGHKTLQLFSFCFSFRGRTNRLHWWFVQLFVCLPMSFFYLFYLKGKAIENWQIFLSYGFIIIFSIVDYSVCARRYHDINKSGFKQLLYLVPIIGPLWVMIECGFLRGSSARNRYGNPVGFIKKKLYYRDNVN